MSVNAREIRDTFPNTDWGSVEAHAVNLHWSVVYGDSGLEEMTNGEWEGVEHAIKAIRELLEEGGVPRCAYWDVESDTYAGENETVSVECWECNATGSVMLPGDEEETECPFCEGSEYVDESAGMQFDPWRVVLPSRVFELL